MTEGAVDAVECEHQARECHGFFDRIEFEGFYFLSNGIEFTGIVELPRFFESVFLNGASTVGVSAVVFREPTVDRCNGVEVIDERLIRFSRFCVEEVAGAEDFRPWGNVVADNGIVEFGECL